MGRKTQSNTKKNTKKSLTQKIFYVFFSTCIIIALILFIGQVRSYRAAQNELYELEEHLSELREEKKELEEEVELLQDEEYIESQARKHLGMVQPGEVMFVVGNPDEEDNENEEEDLE